MYAIDIQSDDVIVYRLLVQVCQHYIYIFRNIHIDYDYYKFHYSNSLWDCILHKKDEI